MELNCVIATKMNGEIMARTNTKPTGRPPKYTPEQEDAIRADLMAYIRNENDPTIVGYVSHNTKFDLSDDYIGEHFPDLVKKAVQKQESYLLSGATRNELNSTFSIFRLKQPQHGYTDKQEREHSGTINVLPILGGKSTDNENQRTDTKI